MGVIGAVALRVEAEDVLRVILSEDIGYIEVLVYLAWFGFRFIVVTKMC